MSMGNIRHRYGELCKVSKTILSVQLLMFGTSDCYEDILCSIILTYYNGTNKTRNIHFDRAVSGHPIKTLCSSEWSQILSRLWYKNVDFKFYSVGRCIWIFYVIKIQTNVTHSILCECALGWTFIELPEPIDFLIFQVLKFLSMKIYLPYNLSLVWRIHFKFYKIIYSELEFWCLFLQLWLCLQPLHQTKQDITVNI